MADDLTPEGYEESVEYHEPRKSYIVRISQTDFRVCWADDEIQAMEAVRETESDNDKEPPEQFDVRETNITSDPGWPEMVLSSTDIQEEPFVPNWKWNEEELVYKALGLEELARKNGDCLPCSQELEQDEQVKRALDPNYQSYQVIPATRERSVPEVWVEVMLYQKVSGW